MKKVSVIVPSYNHKKYITHTVRSVLEQDYPEIELIVVDDGSQDGTTDLLKELNINEKFKLVLKENEGICATLNRGLSTATGDYIVFIASDDYMSEGRIAEQVKILEERIDVDIVAGAVTLIDANNKLLTNKYPRILGELCFDNMLKRNLVAAPTAMFRKSVFNRFGLYPEKYAFEDYYMWLKVLSGGGKILNTKNIWAFYRIAEYNFEKRFVWYFKGFVQTLSDYLPDPRVEKMIQKYRFVFCVKMALHTGNGLFTKYKEEVRRLPIISQLMIKVLSILPRSLRNKVLMYSIKKY